MTTWTQGKQRRVFLLVAAILTLTASYLTFDWTQYALGLVRLSDPELMYSRFAKTLTSFLVLLLAWSVGEDGVTLADGRLLRRAVLATFGGDLLFLLDELHPAFDTAAVAVFLLGHLLIIVRNGQGLRAYLRHRPTLAQWALDLISAVVIALVTALLFRETLLPLVQGSPLLLLLEVYAVVLAVSLWTGWASTRIGYFPPTNARLIAAGATAFFVGDYMVGFNLSLDPSLTRAATLFLTWAFYAPAITLFALSGYRWQAERALKAAAPPPLPKSAAEGEEPAEPVPGMYLETPRLLVRRLKVADAEPLARIWSDPRVTRHMGGPRDYQAVRNELVRESMTEPPPLFDLWPVEERSSGRIVGHCGLLAKEVDGVMEHELIYVFEPAVWGRGYASEVAMALRDYAIDVLGLKRLISLIDPENSASEQVARRVGMRHESDTKRPGDKLMRVYALTAPGQEP